MRKPLALPAATVVILAALTSCRPGSPVALPACTQASSPTMAAAAAQVSVIDNGSTICLPVGLVLGVVLSVPTQLASRGWARIEVSDPAVLTAQAGGGPAVVGTVHGLFKGKKRGVAKVASFLPPCLGPAASCPIQERWTVTVVVD